MAKLGSSLLSGLGQAAAAATRPKPKKKRGPVRRSSIAGLSGAAGPAPRKTTPIKRQEVPASKKKREVHLGSAFVDDVNAAAKIAVARPHKSPLAGLHGTAHPKTDLPTTAKQLTDALYFGPHVDARVPVHKSGGGLGLAAALSLATANPVGSALVGGAKALQQAPGILGRLGDDAVAFPKQAVLGTYALGHAGVEALLANRTHGRVGNYDEATTVAKGLTQGAAGQLLTGHPGKALKVANQHPLYALLDLAGAEGLVGRAAGAGARGLGAVGAEGNALSRAGSLAREDLKIGDTGQIEQGRRYSKDLLKKGGQVALERRRVRKGLDPHAAKTTAPAGKLGDLLGLRSEEARKLDRGGNETIAQRESVRRMGRGEMQGVSNDLAGGKPKGRTAPELDLVQSVVEQEVRAQSPAVFVSDMKAKLQRLEEVDRSKLEPEARMNNRAQAKVLRKVIDLDPAKREEVRQTIVGKADEYVPHADRIEADKITAESLDKDQALATKVRTYAVTQKGYRYEPAKSAPEEMVARHEEAKAVEQTAREDLKTVSDDLNAARHARSRLVGAQSSRRGRRGKTGGSAAATRAEKARMAAADAKVRDLKVKRRDAGLKFSQARRDRVASDPKQYVTGLVDQQGRRVSTARILEDIAADPHARMPSFVPHITDTSGGRAHFVNFFRNRKTSEKAGVRTGSAAATGAQDASIRALGDSLVRGQGELDATRGFDKYVGDLAVKHPDGRMFDADEVHAAYLDQFDDLGHLKPGVTKKVPVRLVPSKYDTVRQDRVEDIQAVKSYKPGKKAPDELKQAVAPARGAARKEQVWGMVPERQLKLFEKHQLRGSSDIGKVVQAYTGAFRGTVLPFSIKWLAGNSVEAALRLAIQDNPVGLVQSARAGRQVLDHLEKLDEQQYREFRARATGGLQYGGQHQTYRGPERFEGTFAEGVATRAHALREIPGVRVLPNRVGAFQRRVFQFNSWVERSSQVVAIGKEARREIESMTGSWSKAATLQKAAVEDVAKGLVNTPNQVRFARAVDETLGKYNRFGPNVRATIQTAAPFLPWYLNSVRFIYHTLPAKHPIKTAVLASTERAMQSEFDKTHQDAFPDLKGALRTPGGGFLDLSHYTPFGVVNEGGTAATGIFLPQFQSILFTTYGLNFTGHPLRLSTGEKVEPGSTKAIILAVSAAAESIAPGLTPIRRLQEQGQSSFDDSTAISPKSRPGTDYGQDLPGPLGSGHGITKALNRILNPVRPTYLHGGPTTGATQAPVPTGTPSGGGGHTGWGAPSSTRRKSSSGWG